MEPWVGRGLLFVAVVLMLEHARPVLLPIAIAIVFAFVLAAPVRALRRRGVHEYLGSALVILAVLTAIALLFLLVAAPAAAWWSRAPEIVHQLVETLQGWRDALFPYAPPEPLARSPAAAPADPFNERLASEGWTFTRLAIGGTISFALSASATVILLYFLLASEHWLVDRTVQAIQRPRTRALVLSGFRQAERDIGLFISTMSIINVALGIATGLALGLIGMPNPVLWGTTTAVLAFIPYIGPLLITVLLLLAGNVTYGADIWMLAPPAVFLVLHGVEANFLSPMFMGHRLRLRPLFVFLSVILWGWLWGITGAFLAVPMLLALRAACRRTSRLRVVCNYLGDDPAGRPSMPIAKKTLSAPMHAMPHDTDPSSRPGPEQIRQWAEELDATPEQIEEAIAAVGPRQADIEMHLKGSRSTSNSDRTREAGG